MNESPPPLYETRAAIEHLSKLLHFSDNSFSQDWELELADLTRLNEFCDLYAGGHLDTETKFALMRLIIASLDDLLNAKPTDVRSRETVQDVEHLLRQDFTIHLHTLNYWCLHDEVDPDNGFAVTPLLRSIWRDCYIQQRHQRWLEVSEA